MDQKQQHNQQRGFPESPFDLSEEASKRPEGDDATGIARQVESDDLNEETGRGAVDSPGGGLFGNNKVSTSLEDE